MKFWGKSTAVKKIDSVSIGRYILFDRAISEDSLELFFIGYIEGIIISEKEPGSYLVEAHEQKSYYIVKLCHMRYHHDLIDKNRDLIVSKLLADLA